MAKGKYEYWLTEEGLLLLEAWARNGLTDEQIAKNVGISKETFYQWKKKYPDFSDSLKRGKEVVDIQVENALLKRALGYSYKEVTKEAKLNPQTSQYELVVTKEVIKEVPPDTTAQIFWLKNRKPNDWRDKRDVAVNGNMSMTNPYDELSVEELKALVKGCKPDGTG